MTLRGYLIGEVTEDYADGLLSRREAMRWAASSRGRPGHSRTSSLDLQPVIGT